MKYLMAWSIKPGSYKVAVERFVSTGAPLPEGLNKIGRRHGPGSSCGQHLVEGTIEAVYEHASEWAGTLEMNVTPIIEDAEAGAIAAKVHG